MMRLRKMVSQRMAAMFLGAGVLFQLGGCNFGEVTTSLTLDGRQLIITLVRTALITPLDAFITETINDAFGDED